MSLEVIKNKFANLDFGSNSTKFYEKIVQIILGILILATLASMAFGTAIVISHLKLLFTTEIEKALHTIILDVLTILAVLEIYKTILAYFSEGRIKVTFILDTVIVTVLTEMIGYLFKEFDPYKIGMMTVLVLILCIMRIFTVKYSPSNGVHE